MPYFIHYHYTSDPPGSNPRLMIIGTFKEAHSPEAALKRFYAKMKNRNVIVTSVEPIGGLSMHSRIGDRLRRM